MKIRKGFVANSSSSSFIVQRNNDTEYTMHKLKCIAADREKFEQISEYIFDICIEEVDEDSWRVTFDHAGSYDKEAARYMFYHFGNGNVDDEEFMYG